MSDQNPYYRDEEHPDETEKREIWKAVSHRLPSVTGRAGKTATPIFHWRSFWLGQAAAVLLLLAIFGAATLWQELSVPETQQSELERTYRSSLQELASTSQALVQPNNEQQREALESQLRGLEEIDRMIEEMRNDMLLNGSTQAKRQQLRRLYATKLNFVQKLILTEEVSS